MMRPHNRKAQLDRGRAHHGFVRQETTGKYAGRHGSGERIVKSEQVAEIAAGVLDRYRLELDDLEIKPAGRRTVVRIVVDGDGPDGTGPGLDEIAEATQAVTTALDDSDADGSQSYTLEVTSRGIDRPLTLPRHWRRNRGRLVTVALADGESVTGRIAETGESGVSVDTAAGDRRDLAFTEVTDARIQIDMSRKPRRDEPSGEDSGPDDDHTGADDVATNGQNASNGQNERKR